MSSSEAEPTITLRLSEFKEICDDVERLNRTFEKLTGTKLMLENESAGAETPAVAETPRARRSDRS